MVIFHCYVSSPEGSLICSLLVFSIGKATEADESAERQELPKTIGAVQSVWSADWLTPRVPSKIPHMNPFSERKPWVLMILGSPGSTSREVLRNLTGSVPWQDPQADPLVSFAEVWQGNPAVPLSQLEAKDLGKTPKWRLGSWLIVGANLMGEDHGEKYGFCCVYKISQLGMSRVVKT